MPAERRVRLLALLSHPIQYMVPLLRRLAAHPALDLDVRFMTDIGTRATYIEGYGEAIRWDVPLLDGYRHRFLPNVSPRPDAAAFSAKINPSIVAEIVRRRPDVLYMHGYWNATEWLAFAAAKSARVPIVFHGDTLIDSPLRGRSAAARELFRRGFCRSIDAALVMSSQARRYYEHYGVPPQRMFWAPLCVDTESWISRVRAQRPRRAEVRARIGLAPDRPMILYVAHMRANKRPLDVIRAFAKLERPATLALVGAGPLYDEVRAHLAANPSPHVVALGARNQGELPELYAAADAFVLPSGPGEVTPLVIQEAMCAGLALVVSDAVPSIIDFVRDDENGYTYPVGDLAALTDRFERALDPARLASMQSRSLEMIRPWNYDATIAGIVAGVDSVLGRTRRARPRDASGAHAD